MRMTVSLRQRAAWLALCATVFASIAPVISHWFASSRGQAWVEICSATASKRVALQTGSAPLPAGDHDGTTHCPFCRLQNDLPLCPPSNIAFIVVAAPDDGDAARAPEAPPARGRLLWTIALSRAPPLFS